MEAANLAVQVQGHHARAGGSKRLKSFLTRFIGLDDVLLDVRFCRVDPPNQVGNLMGHRVVVQRQPEGTDRTPGHFLGVVWTNVQILVRPDGGLYGGSSRVFGQENRVDRIVLSSFWRAGDPVDDGRTDCGAREIITQSANVLAYLFTLLG